MEAMLVVDIQPETVEPRHAEGLLPLWNELIESCNPEHVAYIANLRPFARVPESSPFHKELSIVSGNAFFKRAPNAFTNPGLAEWLKSVDAKEVSIIGIDGNWCIKATALGALKKGFKPTVLTNLVSSKNDGMFKRRTVPKLLKRGVLVDGS